MMGSNHHQHPFGVPTLPPVTNPGMKTEEQGEESKQGDKRHRREDEGDDEASKKFKGEREI